MELRKPPVSPDPPARDGLVRVLLTVTLLLALVILIRPWFTSTTADRSQTREVASKLKAAGALDESAALYESYLKDSDEPASDRAKIAFSLGDSYLDQGRYERALRWFYEAETLGAGELANEVGQRIVQCLERLGRTQAAQAALAQRVALPDSNTEPQRGDGDPVVARIGQREVRRSEVERALDGLPPEVARQLKSQPEQLVRQYVADELIWRKARKLGYDRDPEVIQQLEQMHKQLAVARFAELDVISKIEVAESDLANFFAANQQRYAAPAAEGEEPSAPNFEEVRPAVERDYRAQKAQNAFQEMVESELAAEEVELFADRMTAGTPNAP